MLDKLFDRTTIDLLLLFLGAAIIFIAFAASFLALIRKARVRTSIKTAKGTICIGEDSGDRPNSPHSTCPHARDIIALLAEQAEMLDTVHTIESRVLKDQMLFVKAESTRLRGKAQSLFLRTLRNATQSKENTGLVAHPEYREYERALKDAISICQELIETAFDENHYAARTEQDFNRYATIKTTEILQTVTDYLNAAYKGGVVTRENIYNENQAILEDVKGAVDRMFWNAREIAVDAAAKIQESRKAFQDKLKTLLG